MQRLLNELYASGKRQTDDEMLLPICRSAFAVLIQILTKKHSLPSEELDVWSGLNDTVSRATCGGVQMDLMVKYLDWTANPVVRDSALTVLRTVARLNPDQALNHVVQVRNSYQRA